MYSLFIGRWQPFHEGHKKLIGVVLAEGRSVVIAVRDTRVSEKNPYTTQERIDMIRKVYGDNDNVKVIAIPDVSEVVIGRDVGWSIREIRLDSDTEAISATKVRGNEETLRGAGFTVWFTGLPCSGKTTIADAVAEKLKQIRENVERLDADIIRDQYWPELGYSVEDRNRNITRAVQLASLLTRNRIAVVTSFITPYQEMRAHARREIGNFVEVYIKCPVEVCQKRDTKGMYKKALSGEIVEFTGISAPYEDPLHPDVIVESDRENIQEAVGKIVGKLRQEGYL